MLIALYLAAIVAALLGEALLVTSPLDAYLPTEARATAVLPMVVALLALTGRLPQTTLMAAAAAISIALVALSGALLPCAVVLAAAAAAYSVGAFALQAVDLHCLSEGERTLCSPAIGFGVLSYSLLTLALVGRLVPLAALIVLLIAFAVGWRHLRAAVGRLRRVFRVPAGGSARPVLAVACVWALVLIVEALAPEVSYDALTYHLGLPRVWLDAGRLVDVPEQLQSFYFLGGEMNYALLMMFGGTAAAKLLSFVWFGMAVAAVYFVARALCSPRAAIPAAALFATTPAIAWQGTVSYVDVIVTPYALLATAVAWRARETGAVPLAAVAGVLSGLALATKVTAILVVIPTGAALLVACDLRGLRARIPLAATFGVAALLAVLPWPLLRYSQTGDPVFPLLNSVFRSPFWPAGTDVVNSAAYALGRFGVSRDIAGFVSLPFALSFRAELFDDVAVWSGLGVSLLVAPIALVLSRRIPAVRYLALTSLGSLVLWAISVEYWRYVMPAFASLSVLAGSALSELAASRHAIAAAVARASPVALMISGLPLLLLMYHPIPERIPYGVVLGFESRGAYLARTLPTYTPLHLVAETAGPHSDVLLLSFHATGPDDEDRLYAPGRVETIQSHWTQELLRVRGPESVRAALLARGITHVYVDRRRLPDRVAHAQVIQRSFLESIGRCMYDRAGIELYALVR